MSEFLKRVAVGLVTMAGLAGICWLTGPDVFLAMLVGIPLSALIGSIVLDCVQ